MTQSTPMNVNTLLAKLRAKGFMSELENAESTLAQAAQAQWPFYMNVILFFGAGIAAVFMISAFFLMDYIDFDEPLNLILWGLLFVVLALSIYKMLKQKPSLKVMFFTQLSLVFMIAGKTFVAIGLFSYFKEFWGVPLGLFVLTCATYFVYPVTLDRFTSAALVLLTAIAAYYIFSIRAYGEFHSFILYGFILIQLISLGFLLTYPKCTYTHIPILYAIVLSLGVSISVFTPSDSMLHLIGLEAPVYVSMSYLIFSFSIIKMMFVCALILLMLWMAGGWRKILTKPFIIITTGIIVFGFVTVSGIIFSLGVLVLGHARRERLLTLFGGCFLVLFIWKYYYFLHVSLMEKSVILVLTGLMLLLGRYYVMLQDWDTNEAMPTNEAKLAESAKPTDKDAALGVTK